MKYLLTLLFATLFACNSPEKQRLLDRQEAINREMQGIYDSMDINHNRHQEYINRARVKELEHEFDSLTKRLKSL